MRHGGLCVGAEAGLLRQENDAAAVARAELRTVQGEAGGKTEAERVLALHLFAFVAREVDGLVAFGIDPPLFHEAAQRGGLRAHTEVDDDALGTEIDRRHEPVAPRPRKPLLYAHLPARALVPVVAPKAAVKVDLPVRFLFGRVGIHFGVVEVLGEFELAEIELRLQLAQVLPRPLHRREGKDCGDLREHRLLLVRRRILGKEGVELRLVPLPRLLERRAVAGREQQAQKIAEIARDDVHAVLAAVHRAHGEDRFAKTADKAEVDAVHARPAEDRSTLWRAEIGIVVLPPHHAEGR